MAEGRVLEQTAREILVLIWRVQKHARSNAELEWAEYIEALASSVAFLFEHWGHTDGGCETVDCDCWRKGMEKGVRETTRLYLKEPD